jgi:hypothetical protein
MFDFYIRFLYALDVLVEPKSHGCMSVTKYLSGFI